LVSALDWGSRGRRFKSGQPDREVQFNPWAVLLTGDPEILDGDPAWP
jgi:hypothetical protein